MKKLMLSACLLLHVNPVFAGDSALRLVSTSPQNTEWLFQLGKGDEIVGTAAFSEFPEAASTIPVIGPLFIPSLEKVIRLRPNYVVLDPFTRNHSFEEGLRVAGIPMREVRLQTTDGLFQESKRFLNEVYGQNDQPLRPYVQCWEQIRSERTKIGNFRYLAFSWADPPILFGQKTLLSDLLEQLGGTNELSTIPKVIGDYPQISEEWLIRHPVDVVFYLADMSDTSSIPPSVFRRWWSTHSHRLVKIGAKDFGRASFTPLLSSWKLFPEVFPKAPERCHVQ